VQRTFDTAILDKAIRKPRQAVGALVMQREYFLSVAHQYHRNALQRDRQRPAIRDILLGGGVDPVHGCVVVHIG
jgi:hypothetical protein